MGEIIIREGSEPFFFYIIHKGRVKIIKEEIIIRDTKLMGTNKDKNPKKMKFGKNLEKLEPIKK